MSDERKNKSQLIEELAELRRQVATLETAEAGRRQKEETQRRAGEARFRDLAEMLPEGIFETNRELNATYANKKALDLFGYSSEDIALGLNCFDMIVPEDRQRAHVNVAKRVRGETVGPVEYEALRKDRSTFPIFLHMSPIERDGKVAGFRGVLLDITERKRLEEEARRAHNLESLGLLAGGMAHDFNNALAGVTGNLELLLRLLDRDSEEYEIASDGIQAASRTKALTQQLMTFADGGEPVREIASIETLIRETTERSLRGATTRPVFRFADDLSHVDMDRGQIGQVIQNLVLNADQAMPGGGKLWISAEVVQLSGDDANSLESGRYVKVSVKDEGIGMLESMLSKAFDPYYSTKVKGHGLGLSISYSIIQKHCGHITATSEQGEGATFTFYLPASESQAAAADEPEGEVLVGTGRILLVDDEQTIHRAMGKTLKLLGYEVESVYEGDLALRAYRDALGSGRAFDVVITDLTIPGGMGGREVAEKLLELDPEARVLVSSGYSNDPVMANYGAYGFAGRVTKPFHIVELASTVKRVVDGGRIGQ